MRPLKFVQTQPEGRSRAFLEQLSQAGTEQTQQRRQHVQTLRLRGVVVDFGFFNIVVAHALLPAVLVLGEI